MNKFLNILLGVSIIILLFSTYFHSINAITQDLGRHIKTGEIIWTTHSVNKTNFFSYTFPDFPFINHHFGSEILFYLIYTSFGFLGTLVVSALCSIIGFLLLFRYSLKKTNLLTVSFISFLLLGILYERTDVRPEAFSYLLFSLFLVILFKNREKTTKWLYVLIPLQLLWVNLHIYWVIGVITVGLFFLDACISFITKGNNPLKHTKQLLPLFFVLTFAALSTALNPSGISGTLYPFRVFDNYGYNIEENQNIFLLWEMFQKRTIIFFWVSVVLLFTLLSIRIRYTRPIDWLISITFTILGIFAIRNFPLFAFAIFIPFVYHLSPLCKPLEKKSKFYLLLGVCCLLLVIWQLHYVFTTKPFSFAPPTGATKAVDFMLAKNLKGPIFNNFDIGSYLIFKLYPKEKVFVDGRPEAYPASFFQNTYIPMQQDPKIFEQIDKKYHFNTIFFAHTDQTPWATQFLRHIVKNPDWKTLYLDDTVIILTKSSPIAPLSFSNFSPSSETIQGYYQLLFFFQKIDDVENMVKTAQKIIEKDPTDCFVLSFLAQTQNSIAPIYQTRYLTSCR